jgi:hypothetical protein
MRQQYAWLAGCACVTVGCVSGNLLVPGRDEPDLTFAQGVQEGNHRVSAKAEDDLHA